MSRKLKIMQTPKDEKIVQSPSGPRTVLPDDVVLRHYHTMEGLAQGFGMSTKTDAGSTGKPEKAPPS